MSRKGLIPTVSRVSRMAAMYCLVAAHLHLTMFGVVPRIDTAHQMYSKQQKLPHLFLLCPCVTLYLNFSGPFTLAIRQKNPCSLPNAHCTHCDEAHPQTPVPEMTYTRRILRFVGNRPDCFNVLISPWSAIKVSIPFGTFKNHRRANSRSNTSGHFKGTDVTHQVQVYLALS